MHVTEVTADHPQTPDFARLERTLRVSIRLMQRGQRELQRQRKGRDGNDQSSRVSTDNP
jgi:hypothetical protein